MLDDDPCSNIGEHQNNAMSPADSSFVKVSLKYFPKKCSRRQYQTCLWKYCYTRPCLVQ